MVHPAVCCKSPNVKRRRRRDCIFALTSVCLGYYEEYHTLLRSQLRNLDIIALLVFKRQGGQGVPNADSRRFLLLFLFAGLLLLLLSYFSLREGERIYLTVAGCEKKEVSRTFLLEVSAFSSSSLPLSSFSAFRFLGAALAFFTFDSSLGCEEMRFERLGSAGVSESPVAAAVLRGIVVEGKERLN